MEWVVDILDQYGKLGVAQIRQDLKPYSRSGETVASIHHEAFSNGSVDRLVILGRAFLSAMETGRGPRKSDSYDGFDRSLSKYLDSLGLPTKTSKKGIKYYKMGEFWFSAKSLAWKMNKEGDKTFREGGREIFTPTVIALSDAITKAVRQEFKIKFVRTMKNVFASLILIGCISCGSSHVYVKEKKANATNKTHLTGNYFTVTGFGALVLFYVLTQGE